MRKAAPGSILKVFGGQQWLKGKRCAEGKEHGGGPREMWACLPGETAEYLSLWDPGQDLCGRIHLGPCFESSVANLAYSRARERQNHLYYFPSGKGGGEQRGRGETQLGWSCGFGSDKLL